MSVSGAGEAQGGGEAVLWFRMRAHILLNGGSLQRSSESRPCPGRERRSRCWCGVLTAPALVSVCLGAVRVETSWRDIEARIQYGYYTEDASALRSLEDTVAADESHDKLHGYYAALLAWRLAQLVAQRPCAARGAAEAYELLARDLLDHGETLGARDALEHALLLAPEFSQARRLMAQIISG